MSGAVQSVCRLPVRNACNRGSKQGQEGVADVEEKLWALADWRFSDYIYTPTIWTEMSGDPTRPNTFRMPVDMKDAILGSAISLVCQPAA
jgi:hypothetical protein